MVNENLLVELIEKFGNRRQRRALKFAKDRRFTRKGYRFGAKLKVKRKK